MTRPIKPRFLRGKPTVLYFKPRGIPLRDLQEVVLEPDEFEALKLHGCDDFNQTDAAQRMRISQPTFARILDRAYKKVSHAIVEGKAIKIEEKLTMKKNECDRGRLRCERRGGRARGRRDCNGPRAQEGECPRLKEDSEGRLFKRDGTGSKQDGKGPRGTDGGPREDCPKRK